MSATMIKKLKKNYSEMITATHMMLDSPEVIRKYSHNSKHFARQNQDNVILNFKNTSLAIMERTAGTYCQVIKDFKKEGIIERSLTSSALRAARTKIKPETFAFLLSHCTTFFKLGATHYRRLLKRRGFKQSEYIYLAVDTTTVVISDHESCKQFGGQKNGTEKDTPMLRVSLLYDVVTGAIVDVIATKYSDPERSLLLQHLDNVKAQGNLPMDKLFILADRGYPSVDLIHKLQNLGCKYLFRVSSMYTVEVNNVIEPDQVVFNTTHGEQRVVSIMLKTGKMEKLLTNEFNTKLDLDYFYFLYNERWSIEISINFIKHLFGKEGLKLFVNNETANTILQIIYATSFVSNLMSFMALIKNEEIVLAEKKAQTSGKVDYRRRARKKGDPCEFKTNMRTIHTYTKLEVLTAINNNDSECVFAQLETLGTGSKIKTYINKGRSFPRYKYRTIRVVKGKKYKENEKERKRKKDTKR